MSLSQSNSGDTNEESIKKQPKLGSSKTFQLELEEKEKYRDYETIKEVGQGAYGSIFLVKKEGNNKKEFAMKVLDKLFLTQNQKNDEAITERIVLSMCKHPSIIKLYESFQTKTKLCFVMDYYKNKDLEYLLKKFVILPHNIALQYAAELVNVLDYLHNEKGVSHNDLKPGNIMLDDKYHLKLIDFGVAKINGKFLNKKTNRLEDIDPNNNENICTEVEGTAEYISPEMANLEIKDYRTNDIWSFGVILFLFYNGRTPFIEQNEYLTLENVKNIKYTYEKNVNIPDDLKDLISKIFVKDTNARLTIKEIKQHKYFESINFDTLLNNDLPINKEKLEELDLHLKEGTSGFWKDFCDAFNSNANLFTIDYKIEKYVNFPFNIIDNYFYKDEENQENNIYSLDNRNSLRNSKKKMARHYTDFKSLIVYEGILKKCGFINKEIYMKLYKDKRIEFRDNEKNVFIKMIVLGPDSKVFISNETTLILNNEKYQTTKLEAIKWYNYINQIIFSGK